MTAALLAGVVSWFASSHEDGLEWSLALKYGQTEGALDEPGSTVARTTDWQEGWAPMPDYTKRGPEQAEAGWPAVDGWGSLAGLIGTAVTLGIVYLAAVMLRRRRRAQPQPSDKPQVSESSPAP